MELNIKVLSSLEKCFPDESINCKTEKTDFDFFNNQTVCFQVAYSTKDIVKDMPIIAKPKIKGELGKYLSIYQVEYVPSLFPADLCNCDDNYLRTAPGLYADPLRPLYYNQSVLIYPNLLSCIFIKGNLPNGFKAGKYAVTLEFESEKGNEVFGSVSANINIHSALLPHQDFIHTEWFYTDCIAQKYNVKPFSKAHFDITEKFIKVAAQNGINMILTPIFTPELDTYIGGERLTTQLIDIEVSDSKEYIFGFEKFEKWVKICLDAGIEYFEFPHFFSQWGAKNAPKIVAKVKGRSKRIFGWDTDAVGEEYQSFLSVMIPALVDEICRLGIKDRCYFHISDEPKRNHIEHYTKCRNSIVKYLDGFPLMDALSDIEFAKKGVLTNPIPAVQHIKPFLDEKIEHLWTYYSGAHGCKDFTGRFLSMPLSRTRIIGIQCYMAGLEGFLHWGFNFWNTKFSYDRVDPLLSSDCSGFNASGDCFLVYPGVDLEVWESLRLNAMREAMEDIRALKLYESRFGREKTLDMVLNLCGGILDFEHYPKSDEFFFSIYKKIFNDLDKL